MNETAAAGPVVWTDAKGRPFRVQLDPEWIRLEGDGILLEIPKSRWANDLYVVTYGRGYLLRVETFEQSLQFILGQEQAEGLLSLLVPPQKEAATTSPNEETQGSVESREELPRLADWPKVSALAVWALICSSLTFLPVVGLVPGFITALLVILHRFRVPRSQTYRHSRALCRAALAMGAAGLAVSALATWSAMKYASPLTETSFFAGRVESASSWGMIVSGIIVVLASLTVHEAAHAITAWWLGDGLAKSLGRVTLNPLAHIDPVGTVLLPLILALAKAPIFGYARPVPVHLEHVPRHHRAQILVSVAGPGSNLLMAAASLMVLLALVSLLRMLAPDASVSNLASGYFSVPVTASGFAGASYFGLFCTLLKLSFVINIALAMFNLMPIPPLDGSWVLEHLFPRTLGPVYDMIRPYGILIFILAITGGLFEYLREPVEIILALGLALLAATTGW